MFITFEIKKFSASIIAFLRSDIDYGKFVYSLNLWLIGVVKDYNPSSLVEYSLNSAFAPFSYSQDSLSLSCYWIEAAIAWVEYYWWDDDNFYLQS